MKKTALILTVTVTMILISCLPTRQATYEYETFGQKRFHKKEIRSREAEKYIGYKCNDSLFKRLFGSQKKTNKKQQNERSFVPVPIF